MSNNLSNDLTEDELRVKLREIQTLWKVNDEMLNEGYIDVDLVKWGTERFEFSESPGDYLEIHEAYKVKELAVMKFYLRALTLGILDNPIDDDGSETWMVCFSQIFELMKTTRDLIYNSMRMTSLIQGDPEEIPREISLSNFIFRDTAKCKPFQKLILGILNYAHRFKYTKSKYDCYEQIIWNGFNTHAWKRTISLETLIRRACNKESNWEMWQYLTDSPQNSKHVLNYLLTADDAEFPEYKPERTYYSFENAIYSLKEDKMYGYEEQLEEKNPENILPHDVVSCNFINNRCDPKWFTDECKDFLDIDTPVFESILDCQKIPPEAKRWIYILCGALFYMLESKNFQASMFIKGFSGTGKSTIADHIESIIPKIGLIASNIEAKFGLAPIFGCYVWMCREVKTKGWSLNQADLQSIITGEKISMPIKGKQPPLVERWTAPGIMFGNEIGAWIDSMGSIIRRLIFIPFDYPVTNKDPMLKVRLTEERAAFIVKCNRGYLTIKNNPSTQNLDIWKLLPNWFMEKRQILEAQVSPMISFVKNSKSIVLFPGGKLSEDLFKTLYLEFCRTFNHTGRNATVTEDMIKHTCAQFGLKLEPDPSGRGKIIVGVKQNGVEQEHDMDM